MKCVEDVSKWLTHRGVKHSVPQPINRTQINEKASRSNQARAEVLDPEVVDRYTAAVRLGDEFPPLVVYRQGKGFTIIDGNHRDEAFKKAGKTVVDAIVVADNTPSEMIELLTVEANTRHGKATDMGWRIRQAMHLLAIGLGDELVASATGLSKAALLDARRADKGMQRAKKLGVYGYEKLAVRAQSQIAGLALDSVFTAAAEAAIDLDMTIEQVRLLIRDVKALGSETDQLRQVGEVVEALQFDSGRKKSGRNSLANPRMTVLSALGSVAKIDPKQMPRLFRTNEERKEVARRAANASLVLMEVEEVLNNALAGEPSDTTDSD